MFFHRFLPHFGLFLSHITRHWLRSEVPVNEIGKKAREEVLEGKFLISVGIDSPKYCIEVAFLHEAVVVGLSTTKCSGAWNY